MSAALTYHEVGGTRGELPKGYHHLREARVIGEGVDVFRSASERLLTWDLHRRAGITVVSGAARATEDGDVEMRWLGQRIPCRVVYIVEEPDRQGFAYGTLEGHPERGEESFMIERDPQTGIVTAHVVAFSKPGGLSTTLIGPIGRILQKWMTRRYLDALSD